MTKTVLFVWVLSHHILVQSLQNKSSTTSCPMRGKPFAQVWNSVEPMASNGVWAECKKHHGWKDMPGCIVEQCHTLLCFIVTGTELVRFLKSNSTACATSNLHEHIYWRALSLGRQDGLDWLREWTTPATLLHRWRTTHFTTWQTSRLREITSHWLAGCGGGDTQGDDRWPRIQLNVT